MDKYHVDQFLFKRWSNGKNLNHWFNDQFLGFKELYDRVILRILENLNLGHCLFSFLI